MKFMDCESNVHGLWLNGSWIVLANGSWIVIADVHGL